MIEQRAAADTRLLRALCAACLLAWPALAGDTPSISAARQAQSGNRELEIIQQWQAVGPVPPRGLEDRRFQDAKAIGITSFQSYVHWSEIEPEQGVLDFSNYDSLVAKLREHGLKWVPFIIAGPYYSTPEWFRESPESVYARCLKHDRDTVIQSIWNPAQPARVDKYLAAMAAHYRDTGVLESVQLGISGNWGESIYPAGGGFAWKPEFHSHQGMWCGDRHAAKSFREWLGQRHGTVAALNRVWHTEHAGMDQVSPGQAFKSTESARRDLMRWYLDSMTRYAEFWVATARKHFPDQKIYLCTGGPGNPALGADFVRQAKMCARYGAGLRITNQNDSYLDSYSGCRLTSAACRHYGTYLTTEPAGAHTVVGVPMRIFDAMSLGVDGMYFKRILDDVFQGSYERTDLTVVFLQYREVMRRTRPRIDVAAFYPQEHFMLHPPKALREYHKLCAGVRDLVDLDMVDETLIADGALDHYTALLVFSLAAPSLATQERIEEWRSENSARFVVQVDPRNLDRSVTRALEGRVWGDFVADGIFHSRTDVGILALNSKAEPVIDHTTGHPVEIAPYAMRIIEAESQPKGRAHRVP